MVLDAATRAFLEAFDKLPKMQDLPIAESRAGMILGQSTGPRLPAEILDRCIPRGTKHGADIPIRILRPPNTKGPLPAALYFHGGGWVLGNRDTHDRLLRELVHESGVAIVFIEYSLAPEAKFPIAIEEAHAAARWIASHGPELNIDGSRLALIGDSSGGNIAAACAHLCKQRGGPHILLQILHCPVCDTTFSTPSIREYANGPFLTRADMQWFLNHYLANPSDASNPLVAPLRFAPDQLKGLPPTLILTAEHDPLRDEAEAYAKNLTDAGVPTVCTRYQSTIHDFLYLNALAQTPCTRAAVAQVGAAMRHMLLHPARM